jgi:hypothetical protein
MVVRDLSNKEFTMMSINLKIKAAASKDGDGALTPVERTILLAKAELNDMRLKRAAAKGFVRHLEAGTTLVWPDSFQNLPHVDGVLWDETTQQDVPITVTQFATTGLHFRVAALFIGPPGMGKTPLCEALAARFALAYQERNEYFVSTGTPDSLRRVAEEGLLVPGVPVVLDEVDPGDQKQHRGKLSGNFLKQLTGVKSGGVIGARYQDIALAPRSPRMITSNASSAAEWFSGVSGSEADVLAIRKRLAVFTVSRPLVPVSTTATEALEIEAAAAAGSMRLARKLGRPM